MKYIQDTACWKAADKRAAEQFAADVRESIDQCLIKALGCNSLNSKDLKGRGACLKVPKPPSTPCLT